MRKNRSLFPPPASSPLIHPLDAVIRPKLTLRRLLNIANKNVQKIPCGLCACVCVVLCSVVRVPIRACANISKRHSLHSIPDERAQTAEIFPGIPLPCLPRSSHSPRGRSGASSNPRCSDRGEAAAAISLSPAPSRLCGRAVPSAGLLPSPRASTAPVAGPALVPPWPRAACSSGDQLTPSSTSAGAAGGAAAAPTFPRGLRPPRRA